MCVLYNTAFAARRRTHDNPLPLRGRAEIVGHPTLAIELAAPHALTVIRCGIAAEHTIAMTEFLCVRPRSGCHPRIVVDENLQN
jgi:hypothetical protein